METANQTPNLDRIPPGVWDEFTRAVHNNGGLNVALWTAYRQLPILFAMSPVQVENYMHERGGPCKV